MATFQELIDDPHLPRMYLVHARPWDPVGAALTDVRLASGSGPALFDDALWRQALLDVLDVNSQIGPVTRPRGRISGGRITVAIGDGELDALTSYDWSGREVTVYMGDPAGAFAGFGTLLSGHIGDVSWDASRMRLVLRDPRHALDVPVQENAFAGTGGAEGGADLKDVLKPVCLGIKRNIEGRLIDTALWRYSLSERSINAVLNAFDRAIGLTFAGDFSDLDSWTPVAGQYATNLAAGEAQLGGKPDGPVTFDIEGDATGGFVVTACDLIERLVAWKGGPNAPAIDAASFSAVDTARPYECGLYIRAGGMTLAEAIDQLAESIGAWTDVNAAGELTIGLLGLGTPVLSLDNTRYSGLQALETPPPAWRTRIGYGRSELVQQIEAVDIPAVASGISGQGGLATQDVVDWAAQITGSGKPVDNADVTSANSQGVDWLTNASLAAKRRLDNANNLIINPGLETGSTYPHRLTESDGLLRVHTGLSRTGAHSFKFTNGHLQTSTARFELMRGADFDDRIAANEGETYYFRFWCRTLTGTAWNASLAQIGYEDAAGARFAIDFGTSVTANSTWQLVECTGTCPAGTVAIVPWITLLSGSNSGEVVCDDAYCVRVSDFEKEVAGQGALATLNTIGASQIDSSAVGTVKLAANAVTGHVLSENTTSRTLTIKQGSGTSIPAYAQGTATLVHTLSGISVYSASDVLRVEFVIRANVSNFHAFYPTNSLNDAIYMAIRRDDTTNIYQELWDQSVAVVGSTAAISSDGSFNVPVVVDFITGLSAGTHSFKLYMQPVDMHTQHGTGIELTAQVTRTTGMVQAFKR